MPIYGSNSGDNNTGAGDLWIGFIAGRNTNLGPLTPGLFQITIQAFDQNTCGATLAGNGVVVPLTGRWDIYFQTIGTLTTATGWDVRVAAGGPGSILCLSLGTNIPATACNITPVANKVVSLTAGTQLNMFMQLGAGSVTLTGEAAIYSTFIMGRYLGA